MKTTHKGASAVDATITRQDGGGFVAIASTGELDRDGEIIRAGCFNPLPASIPVHLDHTMSAASLVGRGRPYYEAGRLMLDAALASTPDAQVVRQKMADGVIDSMSIVFRALEWEEIDGVRTCVRGELLAADLVSVPSQPNARVLSMRSFEAGRVSANAYVHEAIADALSTLAQVELAEAKRFLAELKDEPVQPPHTWSASVLYHLGGTHG